MFVEITIALENDEFDEDDNQMRLLKVSNTQKEGIHIGVVNSDGDLIDYSRHEILNKESTLQLRDFLNYVTNTPNSHDRHQTRR